MCCRLFFSKARFAELIFNDQEINGILTIVLPHPSPLNRKWYKDHPDFDSKRVFEIRNIVHRVLGK
jgi:uracil-DNA glycosylase